jgi:hypothetical protein
MRITLVYLLALGTAHLGGLLGILLSAALLMRLGWHGFSDHRLYSLYISSGATGHVQRAVLGFGRALLAFFAGRIVLSQFNLAFTPLFAGLATVWFIAWDVYGAVTGCAYTGRSTDPADVLALQARARVAIPVNLAASLLAAWIFVRAS